MWALVVAFSKAGVLYLLCQKKSSLAVFLIRELGNCSQAFYCKQLKLGKALFEELRAWFGTNGSGRINQLWDSMLDFSVNPIQHVQWLKASTLNLIPTLPLGEWHNCE